MHVRSRILSRRPAFTLVEMMLVMGIIAILAGFVLAVSAGARAAANVDATRSLITRLNSRLMAKWDSYRYRRLPVDLNVAAVQKGMVSNINAARNLPGWQKQALRMEVIWEWQRFELPDQWADIDPHGISGLTNPVTELDPPSSYKPLIPIPPAALASYQRIFRATVNRRTTGFNLRTDEHQSAECLYLIMTVGLGEESLSAEELAAGAVGDKDLDGFLEFHDGWGEPIRFMRWAPEFVSDVQPMRVEEGEQIRDPGVDPDPLDYTKIFQPARNASPPHYAPPYYGFRLVPVIESGGPDKTFDRNTALGIALDDDDNGVRWNAQTFGLRTGQSYDILKIRWPYNEKVGKANAVDLGWIDNIHSHQGGNK